MDGRRHRRIKADIKPRRVYSNTAVRSNTGCAALMRGPVVYCIEDTDNAPGIRDLRLPRSADISENRITIDPPGEVIVLTAEGLRLRSSDSLYDDVPPVSELAALKAIPYFTWGNRGVGAMKVWIPESI